MARRSEHSQQEIKEMVLNAARTIVIEEGYAALKVRKIALAIGYTVGSVYMVFENMADLILHIKAGTLDDIALELATIKNSNAPDLCIMKLAKAYLEFARKNFNRWSMIFEHQQTEGEVLPDWYRQKVNNVFKPLEVQIKRLAPDASDESTRRAASASPT